MTTSSATAPLLPPAEAGNGEDDDKQGDRNDPDADRAPQGRGQHGDAEIGRFGEPAGGAGAERRLVIAGRGLARNRQRRFDVLRLAGLDWDAGQLLAAISLGEADLEILRRVGAEIYRRVAAAVVGDADLVFERGRGGAAQRREIGRYFQFSRKLLADRDLDR